VTAFPKIAALPLNDADEGVRILFKASPNLLDAERNSCQLTVEGT
jgi:hypothetical protein